MTLPRPFYDADGVTLYHCDCRPILATLDPARVLVIADPPYGIAHPCNFGERGRGVNAKATDYEDVIGDDRPFDPAHLLGFRTVIFGANHFSDRLPSSDSWLIWDKRVQEGKGVNDQADGEMAWSNASKGVRIFRHMWNGYWRDSERGEHLHPTQKPVALAKWIISRYARPGDTIVEPYMGAGFATVAAHQLGFPAIACELVEDYCRVVVRRVSQRVLDFGGAA